ncbi:MAG: HAMP domain-containing histidine kinase [Clostridia bacterium]|nr:HAMP domain-containing histidine kinase [Clostridia bacterium]
MHSRLFKKFFVPVALIIMLSLTGMMITMTLIFNKYLAVSNYKSLNKACDAVADFTQTALQQEGDSINESMDQYLYYITSNISDVYDFDVITTDATGQVRSCSCDEWKRSRDCRHSVCFSPIIVENTKKNTIQEITTLDAVYARPRYVCGRAIYSKGNFVGLVFATAPMSITRSVLRTTAKYYLISAIVPLIVIFFAIYTMTYRLTRPLKQMSRAAQAMATGDFSKRIPVTTDDEIGDLAISFNRMTDALAQLENMRRSFVANVSHELRTPMTTIGGFIDGIIDGTIEPERQSYYLKIVSDEVKRLTRLVKSMLNIAKLESGEFVMKPETFGFSKLLLEIVVGQEQRIEPKNINIVGLDELPDIGIIADRDLIYQAVYNLIDNAIKFTEENGEIQFSVSSLGEELTFTVSNSGKGIPADSLPYVFERFYKVDKSRSANKNSTGLGLYLVKTIVKAHGGTVTATSVENEKTVFELVLPLNGERMQNNE